MSRCAPPTDTVTGDRGVYVPDTGIARIVGNVRITRGENQMNGQAAEVNMKTGIARLLSAPIRAGAGPDGAERRQPRLRPGSQAGRPNRRRQAQPAPSRPRREQDPHEQRPPMNDLSRLARQRRCTRRSARDSRAPGWSRTASARPTRSARWCGTSRSRCAAARRSGCSGPNGAGKTTTFYMIVGLVRPDTGCDQRWTAPTSPACRCTAAPAWASATCRRRPACSAA